MAARSKLDRTIAQLSSLKNQIRLELNQLRPHQQLPLTHVRPSPNSKKLYTEQTNRPTDIVSPRNVTPTRPDGKRHVQGPFLVGHSHTPQKKHYQRHYADGVKLDLKMRRTSSPYFTPPRKTALPSSVTTPPKNGSKLNIVTWTPKDFHYEPGRYRYPRGSELECQKVLQR